MADETGARGRSGINPWKVGFFVMLILFEIAREWAVLASDQPTGVIATKSVSDFGDTIIATGRWRRTDGGSSLVPATVRIECQRNNHQCTEIYGNTFDGQLSEPDVSYFDAEFTGQGVAYTNDIPRCARYAVNIDTKAHYVTAVRERKPQTDSPTATCLRNALRCD